MGSLTNIAEPLDLTVSGDVENYLMREGFSVAKCRPQSQLECQPVRDLEHKTVQRRRTYQMLKTSPALNIDREVGFILWLESGRSSRFAVDLRSPY